jgi:hypothetical protein
LGVFESGGAVEVDGEGVDAGMRVGEGILNYGAILISAQEP